MASVTRKLSIPALELGQVQTEQVEGPKNIIMGLHSPLSLVRYPMAVSPHGLRWLPKVIGASLVHLWQGRGGREGKKKKERKWG